VTIRSRAGRSFRTATEADAAAIAALELAPAQRPFVMAQSEAQHRRQISNPNFRYLIYDGPDGTLRGFAILAGLTLPHRAVEIFRVVVDGKGFGIGGDFLDTIVRHAFLDLGAHRIWTDCFDDNKPVRRVCTHYGFREEGMLRETVFFDGRFRSVVLFGLLESETSLKAAHATTMS
jgi:diamine N-acetyltransferase